MSKKKGTESGKVWLVGGGLPAPCRYGQLVDLVTRCNPVGRELASVSEVLLEFTRALHAGRNIALREPGFAGEGAARAGVESLNREIVAAPSTRDFLDGVMANTASEIVLATSGSTGQPATVAHRLRTLARAVVVAPRHADDVWGLTFNPTHIAGVQVYLQGLANGNTMVNLWGVGGDEAIARCRAWRVTHLSATPTCYRMMMAMGGPLPEVRSVSVGGESADERFMRRLRVFFPRARLHNIYASTEAGTLLMSDGAEFVLRNEEAGRVRIADGRLWVQRDLLGALPGADEWFDTGDQVEVTSVNPLRFRIVGRRNSWVNVGGDKINPAEVESALLEHPALTMARVYGCKNSVTGEILTADLVASEPRPGEVEVRGFLARRLPAAKIPRILRFVDRLDLTRSGKVKRDD